MAIEIQDGFEISTNKPVDSRYVFDTIAERNALDTLLIYEGLVTYVKEDKTAYVFSSNDPYDLEAWIKLGSGGGVGGGVGGGEWETDLDAPTDTKVMGLKAYAYPWEDREYINSFLGLVVPEGYDGQEITVRVPFTRTPDDLVALKIVATVYLRNGTTKTQEYLWQTGEDEDAYQWATFIVAAEGMIEGTPLEPGDIIKLALFRNTPTATDWNSVQIDSVSTFDRVFVTNGYMYLRKSGTLDLISSTDGINFVEALTTEINVSEVSTWGDYIVTSYVHPIMFTLNVGVSNDGGTSWTFGGLNNGGFFAATSTKGIFFRVSGPNRTTEIADSSARTVFSSGTDFGTTWGVTQFVKVLANNTTFLVRATGGVNGDSIYTSTNGTTWSFYSSSTLPFDANLLDYAVVYNNLFLVVSNGTVYFSNDAVGWAAMGGTLPSTVNGFLSVVLYEGLIYGLTPNGKVYYTPNLGINWTEDEAFTFGSTPTFYGMAAIQDRLIAFHQYLGATSSNARLKATPTFNEGGINVIKNLISVSFTESEDE